jgi:alpha-tubulin suppressor-like RCC1 family protein/DNA-binding beta-propeller fold protein YncE
MVAWWGSLTGQFPVIVKSRHTTTLPTPVQLPGRVAEVATSNSTLYALLTNGRVYAWGLGQQGQLGDGRTTIYAPKPVLVHFPAGVRIAFLPINVMPFDTGLAVDTTGRAWGWGFNGGGELCLGSRHRFLVPVRLPFRHVTALAGALQHAAYESAGQVWACGSGRLGQLGDGSTNPSLVPTKVVGLGPSAHVVTLVASFGNEGALLANGRYLDWGTNALGQAGVGSAAPRFTVPVPVRLPGKVVQVAQGGSAPGNGQTLVQLSNGGLFGWGANGQGQLGNGQQMRAVRSPIRITPPSGVTYRLIASTGGTSYGVTRAGDVYAWGAGARGEIGNGTTSGSLAPVKVARGTTGISGTAEDVLIAGRPLPPPPGALTQLPGRRGCLVGTAKPGCQLVRALRGPGPGRGSDAVAVSPDGKNIYAAADRSHAIAVFGRNQATGKLTQAPGPAGCVAARGAEGCGPAVGLADPLSVAVSPDGKNVYAASGIGSTLAIFARNPSTGALTQLPGTTGCVARTATPRCASARALIGPDAVAVSPDGKNVYVGAFRGDATVAFSRNSSTGALTQLPGTRGCISSAPGAGCARGVAMRNPEGLTVSNDGNNVYVAAPLSNAVDVLARDPATGALTQATDGTGCLSSTPQAGCSPARAIGGVEVAVVSPNDRTVYTGAAASASIAIFTRASSTGDLTQAAGTAGCVQRVRVNGCAPGRPLVDPEGLAITPDGAHVYSTDFAGSALNVFDVVNPTTGELAQKPAPQGCFTTAGLRGCTPVRGGVLGVSSSVVSPDGRYLYAVANVSNSLTAFSIAQ